MVIPLFVGRPKSIKALEAAMEAGKQHPAGRAEAAGQGRPEPEDLYEVGSVATILQMLKLPDGTVKVLVEGTQRARIDESSTTRRALRRRGDADAARRRASAHEVEAMRRALLAAVRPVREAQQEDPARDPDLAVRHRRRRPPGRHDRRAPAAQARAEAEGARDVRRRQAPRAPARRCSRARSTSCRSRSASAAASSARWRRASASTT